MRKTVCLILGLFGIVLAEAARAEGGEAVSPLMTEPAAAVETWRALWRDETRGRDVPVKIYYPKQCVACGTSGGVDGIGAAPLAVIIFSHGLGGSREGYAYLGEHWAAHGYVSVHVQHAGSDEAVWKNARRPMRAMREAARDPVVIANRPLDVKFVLDRLTELAADEAFVLHGRLDLGRVGMAGHSFGAFTTMAVAGQAFARGGAATADWADERVKAAVAMSTPVPERKRGAERGRGYDGVRIPVFHLTGTEDSDALGGTSDPASRRVPYDETTKAPAWLMVLAGGDHRVFGGPGNRGSGRLAMLSERKRDDARDAEFHALILRATTAFWDARLQGDASAASCLDSGGLAAEAGALATFEHKAP